MRHQSLYSDSVLTAREVMNEPNGARLAWRAAWRFVRQARGYGHELQRASYFKLSNAVLVMLCVHHSPVLAGRITNQVLAIVEMYRSDRSAARGYREWDDSRNGHSL